MGAVSNGLSDLPVTVCVSIWIELLPQKEWLYPPYPRF